MTKSERINKLYDALYKSYGPQGWWPGESKLEYVLGAILTQSASWKNVEKALDNLKMANLISVEKLNMITADELAPLIRPSGYYNQKALKIKNFINFLIRHYSGSLDRMLREERSVLRDKLLGIKGIGPETADSIMLYAGDIPVFVIDAYTYRVMSRHGLVPEETNYGEMQDIIMGSLTEDAGIFNEYHALLVKVGKEHCKKRAPQCKGCPLEYDPHAV
ncbi:MAG: endonuclease III domain-containing protein [Deltaproteobacteria bacterium]